MACRARSRAWLVTALLAGGLAAPVGAQAATSTCAQAGISTAPAHGSTFYVDLARRRQLRSGYAGFTIASTVARTDLWLRIDGTSGGSVMKAEGQPAAMPIGAASVDMPAVAYVYLTAWTATEIAQVVTYSLWDTSPADATAHKVCTFTDTYSRVVDTDHSAANTVTAVTVANPTPAPGELVTITVAGHIDRIGTGPAEDPGTFNLSLSKYDNWPAGKLRLVSTIVTFSNTRSDKPTTLYDRLHLTAVRGAHRAYELRYTVRIEGALTSSYLVAPIQDIARGDRVKHTRLRRSGTATIGTGAPVDAGDDPDLFDDTTGAVDPANADVDADDGITRIDDGGLVVDPDHRFMLVDAGLGRGATCVATLNDDRSPPVEVHDSETYSTTAEIYRSKFHQNLSGFEELSGHWIISHGALTQEDSCGFDYTALLTRHILSDFAVEATFHADGANQAGVVFNQSSPTTRSGASVVDLTNAGSALRWGHYDNAGYYKLDDVRTIPTVAPGQQVTIKVVVHAATAAIHLDGQLIATMTNSNVAGYVGVVTNQSKVNFDTVKLTGLPAQGERSTFEAASAGINQ